MSDQPTLTCAECGHKVLWGVGGFGYFIMEEHWKVMHDGE